MKKKNTKSKRPTRNAVGSDALVSISPERLATLEYIARSFIEFAEGVEDYDGSNDPSMALDAAKSMFPEWERQEMPLPC